MNTRLQLLLANHDRLWVMAGDGRLGNLPAADEVYQELVAAGWQAVNRWHYSTLVLTEYERNPDSPSTPPVIDNF